jgi:hypothetical protein
MRTLFLSVSLSHTHSPPPPAGVVLEPNNSKGSRRTLGNATSLPKEMARAYQDEASCVLEDQRHREHEGRDDLRKSTSQQQRDAGSSSSEQRPADPNNEDASAATTNGSASAGGHGPISELQPQLAQELGQESGGRGAGGVRQARTSSGPTPSLT